MTVKLLLMEEIHRTVFTLQDFPTMLEDVIVVHQFIKRWPAFSVVICRRGRRQLSSSATGMQVEFMASAVC